MNSDHVEGFTLLEVLVALAVATLGMLSLTLAAINTGSNATKLREQSLAHWVAMNQAAELRLAGVWPETGLSDGTVEFAGTQWRWETEISETDIEALRRADITVAYADRPDDEITNVAAFIKQPSPGVNLRPWSGTPRPNPQNPRNRP